MVERSIYLINPRENAPGYYNMEVLSAWGVSRMVNLADLTTPTVAAMLPADWRVALCDERIEPVDFETDAEIVGITGKVSQRDRIVELAAEFRARGKLVMIGGPYASLNPDDMRPHADILVRGEIEDIAAGMFAEIASGKFQSEYVGTRPDLRNSPMPRWDLYPKQLAMVAQIQTSRGCPFECEFCDVIQYLGRKQRWKEPDQVIRELDVLYDMGYRHIYLADDNLTVVRRRARELLAALVKWNESKPPAERVSFSTQLSIDISRDEDILDLCVRAGLRNVFIGVETPNEESLAETKKRQNLKIDMVEEIGKFARHGIVVTAGMIVGFDHDGLDIFERQYSFVQRLPVPLPMISILVAPAATPLRARMATEGRLIGDDRVGGGGLLRTNIMPKNMTYDQLIAGTRWLLHAVYEPMAFLHRIETMVALVPDPNISSRRREPTPRERKLYTQLARRGPAERRMIRRVWSLAMARGDLRRELLYCLMIYCQIRYMLEAQDIWRPELVGASRPHFLDAPDRSPDHSPDHSPERNAGGPAASAAMVGVA
ncbi:MAG: radical SAM protein [Rhodospirillaceae bacterium]|nr:radical SAM protein [Rhodospirillaceae bacterium]